MRVPKAHAHALARHSDAGGAKRLYGGDAPLSVQGQVQRLIDEATDPENLCQMCVRAPAAVAVRRVSFLAAVASVHVASRGRRPMCSPDPAAWATRDPDHFG